MGVGSSGGGQKLEILFDKIIIFASCTHVTEVLDLAQRRTRLTIWYPHRAARHLQPGAGRGGAAGRTWPPATLPLFRALDQTWQISSQKKERKKGKEETWGRGHRKEKKTLKFGLRLFKHSNPFVLMGPGAAGAGTGPWNGKIWLPQPIRYREDC